MLVRTSPFEEPHRGPSGRISLPGPRRAIQHGLPAPLKSFLQLEVDTVGLNGFRDFRCRTSQDVPVKSRRHLRHGRGGPCLHRWNGARHRGIPVDTDGVPKFLALRTPLVADVIDSPHRKQLGRAAVRDDLITRLQLAESPQLVRFTTDRRFGAVVRPVLTEHLAEGFLALELRQIADLVPADADVAVLPAIFPESRELTWSDLHDLHRGARVVPVVDEEAEFLGRNRSARSRRSPGRRHW